MFTSFFNMFCSIDTKRVNDFMDHFFQPDISDLPPADFKKHPKITEIPAQSWLQCKYFPNIYIVKEDLKYFYCSCSKCDKWYSLSGTIGNIKKHISHKHLIRETEIKDLDEDQIINNNKQVTPIALPDSIDKMISISFKKMILKTGRPFSMIEDKDMKSCLKNLGTRSELVSHCDRISKDFKLQMKYILNSGSFISIAIDEWSDLNKRRFLGITAKCLFQKESKVLFISLKNISSFHTDNEGHKYF